MPTCILCVFCVCNDLDYEELYQQLMQSWTSHLYEIENIYSIILTYNSWKHVDMGRGENNGLMIRRIRIQEIKTKCWSFYLVSCKLGKFHIQTHGTSQWKDVKETLEDQYVGWPNQTCNFLFLWIVFLDVMVIHITIVFY